MNKFESQIANLDSEFREIKQSAVEIANHQRQLKAELDELKRTRVLHEICILQSQVCRLANRLDDWERSLGLSILKQELRSNSRFAGQPREM